MGGFIAQIADTQINGSLKPLTILTNIYVLDVWLSFEFTSTYTQKESKEVTKENCVYIYIYIYIYIDKDKEIIKNYWIYSFRFHIITTIWMVYSSKYS